MIGRASIGHWTDIWIPALHPISVIVLLLESVNGVLKIEHRRYPCHCSSSSIQNSPSILIDAGAINLYAHNIKLVAFVDITIELP